MEKVLKLFTVEFDPIYPVGGCLVILAYDFNKAIGIAKETIKHTKKLQISEVEMDKPKVVVYLSGDY